MADTPSDSLPADPPRPAAPPVTLDVPAVLAALQDQLDELAAAVEAQQRLLDAQQRRLDELAAGRTGRR